MQPQPFSRILSFFNHTIFINKTLKLDGVAPLITDPPPTSSTTLSGFFQIKKIWEKKLRFFFFLHLTGEVYTGNPCDPWAILDQTKRLEAFRTSNKEFVT